MREAPSLLAIATSCLLAGASGAQAEMVSYTFAFSGATGSIGDSTFAGATVAFTLVADTDDVMAGSPRGFHVTPLSGFVTLADGSQVAINADAVANSAVWTYTTESQGLRVGYGSWVPFADFTSGSYAGPLGWSMASSFSAAAVGTDSILRELGAGGAGISTSLGAFRVSSYDSTTFAAIVVPAPHVLALAVTATMFPGRVRRRRTLPDNGGTARNLRATRR